METIRENGVIALNIPGKPLAFARSRVNGKRHFTPEPQASYMEAIAWEAKQRMRGEALMCGPIFLQLRATFERPKDHYSKAGVLKSDAPRFKTTKPDCDNLVKLAKDAMNRIVYRDDAQVVRVHAEKVYGFPEGLTITVTPLEEPNRISQTYSPAKAA